MSDIAADVFAYGLAAGLSGTAFLATVIILASDRGRANASALWVGFVLLLTPTVMVAALLSDLVTGAGGQQIVAMLVKLLLGLFLLSLAWRLRPGSEEVPDIEAKLAGLTVKAQSLAPPQALRAGVGVAALPKRLAISILAGAAIGASDVSVSQGLALSAVYVLTASGVVWLTILAYALGGDAAQRSLESMRTWVTDSVITLGFGVTLLFGILFTGQALLGLLL